MANNERGNPNWIAGGWGEPTKTIKVPVRIANKIHQLRHESRCSADEILSALNCEFNLRGYVGDWIAAIETRKIKIPPENKPAIREFLGALIEYWDSNC